MKKKYLPLYEEWIKTGKIEDDVDRLTGWGGLCNTVLGNEENKDMLKLFEPLNGEHSGTNFWAADLPHGDSNRVYGFTPMRQTIVLFLAAINGEL
jgi:hypothetical protein